MKKTSDIFKDHNGNLVRISEVAKKTSKIKDDKSFLYIIIGVLSMLCIVGMYVINF